MAGNRPSAGRRVGAMLCWLMSIGGLGTTVDLAEEVPAASGGDWVVSIGLTVAFAVLGYYLWTTPKASASPSQVGPGMPAGAQPQIAQGFVPGAQSFPPPGAQGFVPGAQSFVEPMAPGFVPTAPGFVPTTPSSAPQAPGPSPLEPYDLSVGRQVVFNYDELEFPQIADVIEGRIPTLDVPMRVVRMPNREGERMRLGMELGGRILTELGPEHVDFDLLSRYVGYPAIAHFSHDAAGLAIRFSVQPQ